MDRSYYQTIPNAMNFNHFDFSCNQPEWTVERTSAIIWCTERWMELATIWIGRCWVLLSDDTFDICHRDMTTMLESLSVSSFREVLSLTPWFLASLKATRPSSREANRVMLSSSQSVIHDKVGDFPSFQDEWKSSIPVQQPDDAMGPVYVSRHGENNSTALCTMHHLQSRQVQMYAGCHRW